MTEPKKFAIRKQPDGSWTVAPQVPLAPATIFITEGWDQVAELRAQWDAIDWFPDTADYAAFCVEFGDPPE